MAEASIRAEVFLRVRDLPYATDAAHDAGSLVNLGRGDCVAKAQLLSDRLVAMGETTRLVRWRYDLPRLVPAQDRLAFTWDIHTAVECAVDGRWVLVDATHDSALARLGLTVAEWDGAQPTSPAYEPTGPVLVVGEPSDDESWAACVAHQTLLVEQSPAKSVREYRAQLNALLDEARRPV